MTKKSKSRAAKLPAPKDLTEAAVYQRDLGTFLNGLSAEKAMLAEEVRELEEAAEKEMALLRSQAIALAKAIREFADKHRAELTDDERRKTVDIPNAGTFRWYKTPPAVKYDKDEEDALINTLEAIGYGRFVNVKKSINKEALASEPDVLRSLEGFSLTQDEKFAIQPGGGERVECSLDTNRWKIVLEREELPTR